jgi:hypothetical protein
MSLKERIIENLDLDYDRNMMNCVFSNYLASCCIVRRIFVIMNINSEYLNLSVYEKVIKAVANNSGYQTLRADQVQDNFLFTDQIFKEIKKSDVILFDLSCGWKYTDIVSGARVAIGLNKPVIFIVHRSSPIQFKLPNNKPIKWSYYSELEEKLSIRLKFASESVFKILL